MDPTNGHDSTSTSSPTTGRRPAPTTWEEHAASASPPARGGHRGGAAVASASTPRLADRLRPLRVGVRRDLEVTRHLFRGEPAYLVRDPMTMQSHRLDRADYEVFIAIQPDRALGEILADLAQQGVVDRHQEEAFYEFIMRLHQLGFLNLPIVDDALLYRRHVARRQARQREKFLGFLFLRVPLLNPDAFLERTLRFARPVFTWWFFGLWLGLMAAAAFVAAARWDTLVEPLHGLRIVRQLPSLWLTLVALKVLHEFGHAFACKRFGGYVPEMGVYLILFTPSAYVDATAAWSFTRKRHRLIVCLAGVYVESIAAALALFVWASSPPGAVRDAAYGVVFLAGVATVLFNINPLMRYDGYYLLSDLLEIPNLRQRSRQYLIDLLKRFTLGVRNPAAPASLRLRAVLLGYGTASTAYRLTVLLAIAAVVASRMYTAGLILAACFLGSLFVKLLKGLLEYLWHARETQPVRRRAIALSALAIIGVPALIFLVPIPTTVRAAGVLGAEREQVIHARVDGFIEAIPVRAGDRVEPGDTLVAMRNETCAEQVAQASARLEASEIRRRALEAVDPLKAREEGHQVRLHEGDLRRWEQEQAALTVRAGIAGTVASGPPPGDVGRFVPRGQPLALVTAGGWRVSAVLTQEQVSDARPEVGESVVVRAAADASRTWNGTIARITPGGTHRIAEAALTRAGGGDINVHPMTGQAAQPYFEVTIDLPAPPAGGRDLRPGMTCRILFAAEPTPVGRTLARRVLRFIDSLSAG